jgi:hypothetical protein
MRTLAAIVLLGALTGCSSSKNNAQGTAAPSSSPAMQSKGNVVVLHPSTRSFKELDTACAGSMGGITFVMNHTRQFATAGVDVSEEPVSGGVSSITFSDKAQGKTVTVRANAHDHSVSGNGVIAKMNGSVACVP